MKQSLMTLCLVCLAGVLACVTLSGQGGAPKGPPATQAALDAESADRQAADAAEAAARTTTDDVLLGRVTVNEGDITTLQTNASTLDSRMTTNEGDITALETGVADLEDRQSNPLQVALLRWYEASEAGNDFAVGNSPHFAAFDGAHIWVTNHLSNTVTKLRAADGATLGNFPTGDHPLGLALRWGPHLGGESA